MLWGVCSSYRRNVLLDVGGFNENFTTNGEDVELGIRLGKRGYRLLYHPDIVLDHHKTDTLTSLNITVYRWFYWGAMAFRCNGMYPLAGLLKKLIIETASLVIKPMQPKEYKRLCLRMLLLKYRAVYDSCIRCAQPRY